MRGKDKGLIKLCGKPLIEYAINNLEPQVNAIFINANRNLDSYMCYNLPVVSDSFAGFHGPLAGMASCMRVIETDYMVSVPCDSPFLPNDLTDRLFRQLISEQAEISVVHDGTRVQPTFSLIKTSLIDSLSTYLNSGERKIDTWFKQHNLTIVGLSDKTETFLNINSPEDINAIEAKLETQ